MKRFEDHQYDEQVKWNDLMDVELREVTPEDIDKVEFIMELIDIYLFGIQQPEGIEKLCMN